jgi:hypothetical protein
MITGEVDVGIVVDDLDAAIAFFSELGMGTPSLGLWRLFTSTQPARSARLLAMGAGRLADGRAHPIVTAARVELGEELRQ